MKKLIFTLLLFSLVLSACAPTQNTAATVDDQIEIIATATSEVIVEEIDQDIEIIETEEPVEEVVSSETPCLICDFDYSSYTGSLSEAEVHGLLLALNDEYRAWAIYDQVLIDFGVDTRPFSNIRGSEAHHIDTLISLFVAYDITVPENLWIGNAPSFDSVPDACAAGVGAEIENAALYDELFTSTEREDIITVYEALQWASLDKHLPAFENCGNGR
jgi:hypothetical protein